MGIFVQNIPLNFYSEYYMNTVSRFIRIIASALLVVSSGFLMSYCADTTRSDGAPLEGKVNLKVETAVAGLKSPWAMAFLPNGNMLVTERGGQLRLVENGVLNPEPIKGLPEIVSRGQGGLLDVTLHPDYAKNGWVYFSYSSPAKDGEEGIGANTGFMRAKLKGLELTDQQLLFKGKPNVETNHHFGGRIVFDKKGFMYLTIGDRGGQDEAQKLTNHRGKVMRLNDDGSVPKDNPFASQAGAMPEIFSYGHRNPQGLVLNPETGDMWEHEHGPQGGDEVNLIQKGNNYGWPVITFGIGYDNSIISADTAKAGMEQPVLYYKPSIAPCGMTFLSSKSAFKDWQGNLLVGSLKFNYLKRCIIKNNKLVSQETILENIGRVRDVREGPDGNIYVVVENGKILRVSPQ